MKLRSQKGFTLIELLVVVAIIGVLASLALPEYQKGIERARSVACMGNLRQIGTSMNLYISDNNGTFPYIEPDAANPVYPDDTNFDVEKMLERLQDYGITAKVLKCPADVGPPVESQNWYEATGGAANGGTSYEWLPLLDGEPTADPKTYSRRGGVRTVKKLSKFRICMDYEHVHFNHYNWLFADGHAAASLSKTATGN